MSIKFRIKRRFKIKRIKINRIKKINKKNIFKNI